MAHSRSTPVDLLLALAEDPEPSVYIGVAWNPRTPASLLTALARRPDACHAVAGNPRAPVEAFAELVKSEDRRVLCHLAQNPQTPSSVLASLITEERLAALGNDLFFSFTRRPDLPAPLWVQLWDYAERRGLPFTVKKWLATSLHADLTRLQAPPGFR